MDYFLRSGAVQADGRAFDERTLQAVNLTAADVNSYRQLVAALGDAKSGSVITITEKVVVPKTLVLSIPDLTIRCSGRGAIVPAEKGLTLFTLTDIGGCVFDEIVVDQNVDTEFDVFIRFIQTPGQDTKPPELQDARSIIIKYCTVIAGTFMDITSYSQVKIVKMSDPNIDNQSIYTWGQLRSYVSNNRHTSILPLVEFDPINHPTRFRREGCVFMTAYGLICFTVSGNSSEGYISFQGSGNIVNNNTIFGSDGTAANTTSITITPTSQRNTIVSNLTGFLPATGEANNLLSTNLDLP